MLEAREAQGKLTDSAKDHGKELENLKEKQADFTKSLQEQIATFGMDEAAKKKWKAENEGLLTKENKLLLEQAGILEQREKQLEAGRDLQKEINELYMSEEEKTRSRMEENGLLDDGNRNLYERLEILKKEKSQTEAIAKARYDAEMTAWTNRRNASGGMDSAILGAASGGGVNSIIDFMGSDQGKNFKFADFLGGGSGMGNFGLGEFGGQMDSFISNIGGMQAAGSYLEGGMSLFSGTSAGAMEGIGQIGGTALGAALGGPMGAQIGGQLGKIVGSTLSGMGIGGSTAYENRGFKISGDLDDPTLAAMVQNNKNFNVDVYD
jgi:hypothetical protein